MATVAKASPPAAAASPPAAAASRGVPPLLGAVVLLAGCTLTSLLLDISLLDVQRQLQYPAPVHHALKDFVGEYELADAPVWLAATPPEVPAADQLHFSLMQAACLAHTESVLPWTYARPGPDQEDAAKNLAEHILYRDNPRLLDVLRQCPEVDVYLPATIRGHGYCEDAVAYAKYLESRVLPRWVMEDELFDPELKRNVRYHELCPHTPVILFNHYWDGVPDAPYFPKTKSVYLMPNIEMYELNQEHYWNVDVVLCKTKICEQRLAMWYAQEGNPRKTRVFFVHHTTTDAAGFAAHTLGVDAIKPKNYVDVKFTHVAGGSVQKATPQVLKCWLSRPDFPPLELLIDGEGYKERYSGIHDRIVNASNIILKNWRMLPVEFGQAIAESSFFLCPSLMEGYGHYINQARAAGGVIITTDAAPMNELVTDGVSGVLIDVSVWKDSGQFLGGASTALHALQSVRGMVADVKTAAVCRAVEHVVAHTSVAQREAMATRARDGYHADTAQFAREMLRLRKFARRRAKRQQKATAAKADNGTRTNTNLRSGGQ